MILKADYSQHIETEEEFLRQDEWWQSPENMAVVECIDRYIPPCQTLLDVGAGSGAGAAVWGRKATAILAVLDASHRCCEEMRRRLQMPHLAVLEQDFRSYSGRADVVVAKAFLKHFGPLEWGGMLRHLCQAARKRLIFTMGVTEQECAVDLDLPAPYWQLCVPAAEIVKVLQEEGWASAFIIKTWSPEWIFVCQRTR